MLYFLVQTLNPVCLLPCPSPVTQNQNKIYKNQQPRSYERLYFAPDVTTGILESYLMKLKISLLNFNEYTKTVYTKRFIYNNNNISIKLSSLCALKFKLNRIQLDQLKSDFHFNFFYWRFIYDNKVFNCWTLSGFVKKF